MNRESFRGTISQEMDYQTVLPYLKDPNPSGVDVENMVALLGGIQKPSPEQARTILDAAADKVSLWVKATDTNSVIRVLTPPLNVARINAETSVEQAVKDNFREITTAIVAGVMSADENSYQTHLQGMINKNQFGAKREVLTGVLNVILPEYLEKKGLPEDDQEEAHVAQVVTVLDDLIEEDPTAVKELQPILPSYFLFASDDLSKTSPKVYQILNENLGKQEILKGLGEVYFNSSNEFQREELQERILEGEFGEPVEILSHICALAAQKEDSKLDELAEEIWLDLLDRNRRDPRLRPTREILMSKNFYWDPESKLYTLFDTVDNPELEDREQLIAFLEKHEGDIVSALKRDINKEEWEKYSTGIFQLELSGEFSERLASIIEEVRSLPSDQRERFLLNVSDEQLLEKLHIPKEVLISRSQQLKAQMIEVLNSLTDRERHVMRSTFGLDGHSMTYAEVGKEMGLSVEEVESIEQRALEKIKRPKTSSEAEEFQK